MALYGSIALGLLLLTLGGDLLVRGASGLAGLFGISPLVIGLTVVAYGTSTPELIVSLQAAAIGKADIAIANVVGSNIFNVLFILGVCSLIAPLIVKAQLVRIDVPIMIVGSVLLWVAAQQGQISQLAGVGFVIGVIIYTVFVVAMSRRETKAIQKEFAAEYSSERRSKRRGNEVVKNLVMVAGGLALLAFGSDFLIQGAVALAQNLGVSDAVIGLTIIAGGTSLPEVFASLMASIKGERDIAVGNIVGSCIYNIFFIAGFAAALSPGGLNIPEEVIQFDIPIMLITAIACLPIFAKGMRIDRLGGFIFFASYVTYVGFLVLKATEHAALDQFKIGVVYVGAPLLVATLAMYSMQALAQRRA